MEKIEQITMKTIFENHFMDDWYTKLLFTTPLDKIKTHKFSCMNDILSNMFLNESKKEEILNIFHNIQKFIHAIYRLKYIWKWKRANIYNTEDLYMNPIHIGDKNTTIILQNNTKYIFHIRELIGSINTSLSNCCHFFLEPLTCKNPYTNIPFDKSSLYNIYFAIRESTFIMPPILHQFFLSDFHLSNFAINNEHLLNKEYLRTYVNNNCIDDVRERVIEMFGEHHIAIKIIKSFPNDILLKIMKPYLNLYYISIYSLNEYQKMHHYKILNRKLVEFIKYNPTFGRKKIRLIDIKPFSKEKKVDIYFDDKHILFNKSFDCDNSSTLFMSSHLYKTDFYNRNLFNVHSNYQINRFSRRELIVNDEPDDYYDNNYETDNEEDNDIINHYYHSGSDSGETIVLENSDNES